MSATDDSVDVVVPQDDDVLTVEQAAKFLRLGRNAVYDAIGRGEIPHRRIGRAIRLSRAALVRWLGSWSSQDAKEGQ
jgi:excisionase family DNA binding protein